ncbi:MAG: hypothetical protein VCB81_05540, partial [Verrucomicrobiia bacterium]
MPHPILAQAAADISYWPLGILAISVAFIFVSIVKLKLHPFLALMLSAFIVGLLSNDLPDATTENIGVFKARTDMQTVTFSKAEKSSPIEVHLNGEFLRTEEIANKVKSLKEKYGKKMFLSLHLIGEVPVSSSEVQLTLAAADQNRVPFALRHRDKFGNGSKLLNTITWSLRGFGDTAGGLCLIIALAAIIGICMLGSGAADRVVRWLLSVFGEKRAGLVLLSSGFL